MDLVATAELRKVPSSVLGLVSRGELVDGERYIFAEDGFLRFLCHVDVARSVYGLGAM